MQKVAQLWPEGVTISDGFAQVSAVLELPNSSRLKLWFRFDESFGSYLPESCDPFVLASILPAMAHADTFKINGEASPSLLQNLRFPVNTDYCGESILLPKLLSTGRSLSDEISKLLRRSIP